MAMDCELHQMESLSPGPPSPLAVAAVAGQTPSANELDDEEVSPSQFSAIHYFFWLPDFYGMI